MTEKLYSIKEVEKILGVTRCTIYTYFNSGKLNSLKVGGKRLITETDLNAFIYGNDKK